MAMTLIGNYYSETVSSSSAGNTSVVTVPSDCWNVTLELVLGTGTSGYVVGSMDGTNYETWTAGTLTAVNKTAEANGLKYLYAVQTTTGTLSLIVNARRELWI
jgi:hypothetical protein